MDPSHGYGLYKMGADCSATPVLIGVIPNGTVIPARGHYLFVGSAYSLANYGGTGAAVGDPAVTTELAFVPTPSRETPTGQATGWLSAE